MERTLATVIKFSAVINVGDCSHTDLCLGKRTFIADFTISLSMHSFQAFLSSEPTALLCPNIGILSLLELCMVLATSPGGDPVPRVRTYTGHTNLVELFCRKNE